MNALETFHKRREAQAVGAFNPAAHVRIPEEPDFNEVVAERARQLLIECTDTAKAETLINDWELLLQQQGEILSRTAETFYAIGTRSWCTEERKDELAALGADLLRIVFERIEEVARCELNKEE